MNEATDMTNSSDFYNLTNFNESMENTCKPHLPIFSILTQILYSIVFLIGILGNSLVIYVVLRFSKMQTVTNTYIVNLAIADECFLVGIPFLVMTMSLGHWTFGEFGCKAFMCMTSINQFTSSIFLSIMSADRYIAVCHPISSQKLRTPLISRVVSVFAWLISIVLVIPVILYSSTMEEGQGGVNCNIIWPENHGGHRAFTLYSFAFGFAIPLVLIFIFYSLVIRKLKTVGPKKKSKEKKRTHKKVTRLVFFVITVYILCWFPYWITQIALITMESNKCQNNINVAIFLFVGFLSYANSVFNPILYAFLSEDFKKRFMKAFICTSGKDINATVHVENSVFPRRNKANAEKLHSDKVLPSKEDYEEEEEGECGLLISKTSTTFTLTSRSNATMGVDSRDKKELCQQSRKDKEPQLTLLTQL